jgi:hypothetical protein
MVDELGFSPVDIVPSELPMIIYYPGDEQYAVGRFSSET